MAVRDKNLTKSVLAWMSNAGPFCDDNRASISEDAFYFENEDVTDQGLGEAARRLLLGIKAHAYSFTGPIVRFQHSPLKVDSLGDPQEVLNFWETTAIEAEVGRVRPESGGTSLISPGTARQILSWLLISQNSFALRPLTPGEQKIFLNY
jgi:hypothetical protein